MLGNTGLTADQGVRLKLVALHRNARQPVREFTEPITVLGSGSGCDLILASSSVDAYHAAIVKLGNAAYLCDLGAPQGTSLNGRRVRWARFAHRDVLELGSFRFGVELQESSDLVTGEQPVFSLRNDETIGMVASIDPVLIVGSDPGCDVVLQDDSIAPRHAIIVWTQEGPVIRDLQRRCATRLNGRDIDRARLMNGDSIGIGPYEMLFETNAKMPKAQDVQSASFAEEGEPQMLDLFGDNDDLTPLVSGCLASDLQEVDLFEPRWKTPVDSEDLDVPGDDILMDEETHERADEISSDVNPEIPIEDTEVTTKPAETEDLEAPAETTASMAEDARNLVKAKTPVEDDLSDLERSRFIEEQTKKLTYRKEMLRLRVAAAQRALDERAKTLKENLDQRREQVKRSELELQRKAAELVEAAREKHQEIEVISQQDRDLIERERRLLAAREAELTERIQVLAEADAQSSLRFDAFDDVSSEAESFADSIRDADDIDLVGQLDEPAAIDEVDEIDEVEEVDEFTDDEMLECLDSGDEAVKQGAGEEVVGVDNCDEVSVEFAGASSFAESEKKEPAADSFELSQRASELAELVRFEREEIEQSESRLQALRFDIERMRTSTQRSRSRYQERLSEIEARSEHLSKQGEALEREREPLLHKLRDIDARATALQTSVQDTKQQRLELDDEGMQIARMQEQLEGKEQDLQAALEKERHRLRVQQAELQHRAAELTKAARKRRQMIEARVSERQAQLERQASELVAQREAIEEERRRELDATIKELGQVVGVRMAEVDSEVRNRQAELNSYMEKFGLPESQTNDAPCEMGFSHGEEPQQGDAVGRFDRDARTTERQVPGESRLDLLQKEIKALHDAMIASEDIDADAAIPQEISIPPASVGRDRNRHGRRSENVDVQLVEETASFRAGSSPEDVSDSASCGKR